MGEPPGLHLERRTMVLNQRGLRAADCATAFHLVGLAGSYRDRIRWDAWLSCDASLQLRLDLIQHRFQPLLELRPSK